MTIRRKVFLAIGFTLVSLVLCLQLVSGMVLSNSFARIEQAEAHENVARVRSALDDSIVKINATATDWAWWDDTYQYVIDRNADYDRSNLGTTSIATLRLNVLVMLDAKGKIVYGTGFDLKENVKTPLPKSIRQFLQPSNTLLQQKTPTDSKHGILSLADGPLLVAVQPILKSNRQGPSHGTLVFGRYLNADEIDDLSNLTRFKLDVQRLDTSLDPDFQEIRSELTTAQPIETKAANENEMWGYALVNDIADRPALILRVTMPRDVHHQQQSSLMTMLFSTLAGCIAFCAVIFVLLEKVVLGRLAGLNNDVRRLSRQHDIHQRVEVQGRDELGLLGGSINELLDTIAKSQNDLLASENRFRTFMDNSPAIAFVKDAEGRFVYVNATFEKCFGRSSAELMGRTDYDMWAPEIADILRKHDKWVMASEQSLQVEERAPGINDQYIDWLIFKFPLRDTQGHLLLAGMGINITQRKQMDDRLKQEQEKLAAANAQLETLAGKLAQINKQLEMQAMYDELTQLSNRRAFNQRLKTEMQRTGRYNAPLSLLLLDIDKFKVINDTWGHSYGDEVLQRVASLLQSVLRSTDLAARYGGEEIAIILPATDAQGAMAMAERFRILIEAGPWKQGNVTASFGVSTFKTGMEAAAFIGAADAALYQSKLGGRNRSTHIDAVHIPVGIKG